MQPFFSVIIPFFNAKSTINGCVKSLASLDYKDVEFIFVDNNSTDETSSIIDSFIKKNPHIKITCIKEKIPGASVSRNSGARHANGRWLAFTDSDCVVDKFWLNDMVKEIEKEPGIAAFAGCIHPYPSNNLVSKFLSMFTLPANKENKIYNKFELIKGGFPTANFIIRKNIFNKICGFNEDIAIYGEDYELCYKIYKNGNSIKSLTNAVIYHIHRTDFKGLIKQSFGFGKSHGYVLKKLVDGAIIISAPLINIFQIKKGKRIWIDLKMADKKMLFLFVLGFLWPLFFLLPLIYYFYLVFQIFKKAKLTKIKLSFFELFSMPILLLIKSISMTAGKLIGSIKYKVICF